jgi:hypothetical protein
MADGVVGASCGVAVLAARGRNPGGTAGAGRGAIGGSKLGGIFGAGRQGVRVEVSVVVRWVPMMETVRPDSQRKSKLVGLVKAASRKLSSETTCREMIRWFVERSRQR